MEEDKVLRENLLKWREQLAKEVGTREPCPWCRVPRVQRSDYVRCNGCGVNWLEGEDLSRDPRLSRAPMVADQSKSAGTSKEGAE